MKKTIKKYQTGGPTPPASRVQRKMEKKAYISSEKAKRAATKDSILTTKKDNRATRAADVIASVGSGKGPKSVSTSNSTTIIDKSKTNSGNSSASGGMGGSGGSGGRSGSSSTSGSSSEASKNSKNTDIEIDIKKKNKEKTTIIQPDYYKKGGATYKKGGSIKRKK